MEFAAFALHSRSALWSAPKKQSAPHGQSRLFRTETIPGSSIRSVFFMIFSDSGTVMLPVPGVVCRLVAHPHRGAAEPPFRSSGSAMPPYPPSPPYTVGFSSSIFLRLARFFSRVVFLYPDPTRFNGRRGNSYGSFLVFIIRF